MMKKLEGKELEKFKDKILNEVINGVWSKNTNILTLYLGSGKLYFISASENEYKTNLKLGSNSYRLLEFMMRYKERSFKVDDLVEILNKPRAGGEHSSDERRVRDTIQAIRKKLRLTEQDDFFVTSNGFRLKCHTFIAR